MKITPTEPRLPEATHIRGINITNPTIGVIGLGMVGAVTLRLSAEAGFRTIGYDIDAERVRIAEVKIADLPMVTVAANSAILASSDVVFLCVRFQTNIDDLQGYAPLLQIFDIFEQFPHRRRLVILQTTVRPGCTRYLFQQLKSRQLTGYIELAISPERLREGDSLAVVKQTPRLVAGLNDYAAKAAVGIMTKLGLTTIPVSSPEVAELAKLLENAFMTTCIGLIGEITKIAHTLGISAHEVAYAASTKPYGYFPFWPGAPAGGHCLPNDLALLRYAAKNLAVQTPLLDATDIARKEMASILINFVLSKTAQIATASSRPGILIVGAGFKVGSSSISDSPANDLVREMRLRAIDCHYFDSSVPTFTVDGLDVPRISSLRDIKQISAAILLSGDTVIALGDLCDAIPFVLDVGGGRVMQGDRSRLKYL